MELKQGKSDRLPPRKLKRNPKYETMVCRLAQRFGIAEGAECYADLPDDVKELYSHYTYYEIIRPLICMDKRDNPSLSFQALANRYGISNVGAYRIILAWVGQAEK